jgi:hypothetical protein
MAENATAGLPQLAPHEAQDTEVMLLAGGPSLNDHWDEIREHREAGMPLFTTNGTYNQCVERGLKPSMQFVIDAREFNKRFVLPTVDRCKYVLGSQCHPDTVKAVPADRSYLWQVTNDEEYRPTIERLWGAEGTDWFPVPGGSTVTLRALCGLLLLGFRRIHVYGLDSCMVGDSHHAYEQTENDAAPTVEVRVGEGTPHDRTFMCQGWMAVQAREFLVLCEHYLAELSLIIYGDGLIAHIVNSGAELAPEEE